MVPWLMKVPLISPLWPCTVRPAPRVSVAPLEMARDVVSMPPKRILPVPDHVCVPCAVSVPDLADARAAQQDRAVQGQAARHVHLRREDATHVERAVERHAAHGVAAGDGCQNIAAAGGDRAADDGPAVHVPPAGAAVQRQGAAGIVQGARQIHRAAGAAERARRGRREDAQAGRRERAAEPWRLPKSSVPPLHVDRCRCWSSRSRRS